MLAWWRRVSLVGPAGRLRAPAQVAAECGEKDGGVLLTAHRFGQVVPYARLLCRHLAARASPWAAESELAAAREPGLLRLARRSGCRALVLGPEPDPLVREAREPGALRAAAAALRRIRRAGLLTVAHLTLGREGDDAGVFARAVWLSTAGRVAFPRLAARAGAAGRRARRLRDPPRGRDRRARGAEARRPGAPSARPHARAHRDRPGRPRAGVVDRAHALPRGARGPARRAARPARVPQPPPRAGRAAPQPARYGPQRRAARASTGRDELTSRGAPRAPGWDFLAPQGGRLPPFFARLRGPRPRRRVPACTRPAAFRPEILPTLWVKKERANCTFYRLSSWAQAASSPRSQCPRAGRCWHRHCRIPVARAAALPGGIPLR